VSRARRPDEAHVERAGLQCCINPQRSLRAGRMKHGHGQAAVVRLEVVAGASAPALFRNAVGRESAPRRNFLGLGQRSDGANSGTGRGWRQGSGDAKGTGKASEGLAAFLIWIEDEESDGKSESSTADGS